MNSSGSMSDIESDISLSLHRKKESRILLQCFDDDNDDDDDGSVNDNILDDCFDVSFRSSISDRDDIEGRRQVGDAPKDLVAKPKNLFNDSLLYLADDDVNRNAATSTKLYESSTDTGAVQVQSENMANIAKKSHLIEELSAMKQKVMHSNHMIENLELNDHRYGERENFSKRKNHVPKDQENQTDLLSGTATSPLNRVPIVNNCLNDFHVAELEKKHRNELEELRTYYEQKCSEMANSYSEEILKEKRKKISNDTDSETSISEYLNSKGSDKKVEKVIETLKHQFESQLETLRSENDRLKSKIFELETDREESYQNTNNENQPQTIRRVLIEQLEKEIKTFLEKEETYHNSDNIELPEELLMLGRCFTENLKQSHQQELDKMRKQFSKNLCENEKELKTMKVFIKKLISYVYECENELNESLVDELLHANLSKISDLSQQSNDDSISKRLRFAPDLSKVNDFLNRTTTSGSFDLSFELNSELKNCLKRFKTDTENLLINSIKLKQMLKDKDCLQTEIDSLIADKNRILSELSDLKKSKFKVVENGYEDSASVSFTDSLCSPKFEKRIKIALSEKAESKKETFLLKLIQDMDAEIDKLRCDENDLKLQVTGLEKKCKQTNSDLIQQFTEHENERDEWDNERKLMKEQLAIKSKEIINNRHLSDEASDSVSRPCHCDQFSNVIQELEAKRSETLQIINEAEERNYRLEYELKKSHEDNLKLKQEVKCMKNDLFLKKTTEEAFINRIDKLENKILDLQAKQKDSFVDEQVCVCECHEQFKVNAEYVSTLECELEDFKKQAKMADLNNEALVQIKFQLKEIEIAIENRTGQLQRAISSNESQFVNCESYSEEISNEKQNINFAKHELSLIDQLKKVIEQWRKHVKIEEMVADKKQQLEAELVQLRYQEKQFESDRDELQKTIFENGIMISTLQLRLEEQRSKMGELQRERNKDLLNEIDDLKNEVGDLRSDLFARNKEIQSLKQIVDASDQQRKELSEELKSLDTQHKTLLKKYKEFERENSNLKGFLDDNNKRTLSINNQLHSDDELCVLRRTPKNSSFRDSIFPSSINMVVEKGASTPNISETGTPKHLSNSSLLKRNLFNEQSSDSELLNKSLNEKSLKVKELENALKANLENYNRNKENWKSQEEELTKNLLDLENANKEFERNLLQKDAIIRNLEEDLKTNKTLLDDCNDRIKLLESLRDNLTAKLDEKNLQESTLRETIATLRAQVDRNRHQKDLKSENEQLKKLLKTKEELITKLNEECKEIRLAMECIRKEFVGIFQTSNSNESIDEINDQLKKQLNYSQNLDESILNAIEFDDKLNEGANDSDNTGSDSHCEVRPDQIQQLKSVLTRDKRIKSELSLTNKELTKKFQKLRVKYDLLKTDSQKLRNLLNEEKQNKLIIERLKLQLKDTLKDVQNLEELLKKEKLSNEKLQANLCRYQQNRSSLNSSQNLQRAQDHQMGSKQLDMLREINEDCMKQLKANTQKYEERIEKLENCIKESNDVISVFKSSCAEHREQLLKATRELENTKILTNELAEEKNFLDKQFEKLKHELESSRSERNAKLSESLVKKIKDLESELTDHMIESRKMNSTIRKLTDERLDLQKRIDQFELENRNCELNGDSVVSVQYLFANLTKLKAYRKILVWQKVYLSGVLDRYRASFGFLPFDYKCALNSSPTVNKFKSVSFAVIAQIRLRKLSKRNALMNNVQINNRNITISQLTDRYVLSSKKQHRETNSQQQQQQQQQQQVRPVNRSNELFKPPTNLKK